MHAKELTSDIARMFNRAFGVFKKAHTNEPDLIDMPDGRPVASNAPLHVLVIDDIELPGLDNDRYVKRLFDRDGVSHGSIDRWFVDVLLKKLMDLATDAEQANARLLFLINVSFCPSQNGKLSSRDGLKILEHIRLTDALPEQIRFCPAVLYSFEAAWQLSAQALHPLLTQGAGVSFARLPEDLTSLVSQTRLLQWEVEAGRLNAVRMQRLLNPSIVLGGGELYAHSYRNVVGAPKFCWEFAGDILGEDHKLFSEFRKRTTEDLHLKRLLSLQPHLQPGQAIAVEDRSAFSAICRDLKFLLVDDEHAAGWSLGLHAGIVGQALSSEEYQCMCSANESWTSDGRMCVASGTDQALTILKGIRVQLDEALDRWKTAFAALKEAEQLASTASSASSAALGELRTAEGLLTHTTKTLSNQEAVCKGHMKVLDELLRQSSTEITEALLVSSNEGSVSNELAPTKHITSISPMLMLRGAELAKLGAAIETLNTAQKQWDSTVNSLEELELKVGRLRQAAETKNQERNTADINCRAAKSAFDRSELELNRVPKFNLAFLDLRIDPRKDSTLPVSQCSGIQLLKFVTKEFPELPVIVVTASEKAESLRNAFSSGASGFWTKGISSGADMREMVKLAAVRADFLPLWLKLRKTGTRGYLSAKEYHPPQGGSRKGTFSLRKIESNDERIKIDLLLRDSFRILFEQGGSPSDLPANGSSYFDQIIINIGKIQELRLNNIIDSNGNTRPGWQDAPPEEQELRSLRNQVVHRGRRLVSLNEVEKFLQFTLDQLLL
jgi:CheY-like chemotaxis protein